jgi:hypothetical protein
VNLSSRTFDLSRFSLRETTECGTILRGIGAGARSMEEVAQRITALLHESLRDGTGEARAAVLVRLFVTLPYADLPEELRAFARAVLGDEPPWPTLKCLTLLGSAGVEAAWNSRATSVGHKALPLASEESITRSPMIAQLITQLGLPMGRLLSPDPDFVLDAQQHTYNVFHVADALGSPHIPAQQQFVVPFGVRSVVGFGGLLPTGDLFATIVFARQRITRETADLFRVLALNVKVALLPFAGSRVFS